MTAETGPSLADDELTLARYSDQLVHAVDLVAQAWMWRLIEQRAPTMTKEPSIDGQLGDAAAAAVDELRVLLARDIADQQSGPLQILRRAVQVPTRILQNAGVDQPVRDPFDVRNFPDDLYGMNPASFADVDPSLLEPGLIWGAAKAHVHLRRRRESS